MPGSCEDKWSGSGEAKNIHICSLTVVRVTCKHFTHFRELIVVFQGERNEWRDLITAFYVKEARLPFFSHRLIFEPGTDHGEGSVYLSNLI